MPPHWTRRRDPGAKAAGHGDASSAVVNSTALPPPRSCQMTMAPAANSTTGSSVCGHSLVLAAGTEWGVVAGTFGLVRRVWGRFTGGMFVSGEVRLEIGFADAWARLADLRRAGLLLDASREAYGQGTAGLARLDPPGPVGGVSGLVAAQSRDLAGPGDRARLALRWEATGPGGELFPVLDADLTLTPAGEHATALTLSGVFRPPPGNPGHGLDQAIVQRVAMTAIRAFLDRVAHAMGVPARAAEGDQGIPGDGRSWPPGSPGALAAHGLGPVTLLRSVPWGRTSPLPGTAGRRTPGRGSRGSSRPGGQRRRRSAAWPPHAEDRTRPAGSGRRGTGR